MKNNYAFGGNNCSPVVSMKPASVPVTSYEAKRVVISGIGAVSAIGHTFNEIADFIWSQNRSIELQPVKFHSDTLEEARELLRVLVETRQLEELLGAEYSCNTQPLPEERKF